MRKPQATAVVDNNAAFKDALAKLEAGIIPNEKHPIFEAAFGSNGGLKLQRLGYLTDHQLRGVRYPAGYVSLRSWKSWENGEPFWYKCSTEGSGGDLCFVIEGPKGEEVKAGNPTAAVRTVHRRVQDAGLPVGKCPAGREFFGFGSPGVKKLLERLPGVGLQADAPEDGADQAEANRAKPGAEPVDARLALFGGGGEGALSLPPQTTVPTPRPLRSWTGARHASNAELRKSVERAVKAAQRVLAEYGNVSG
ncbi:hypothetical protein DIPPA_24392 [Diplonema papillatum]|nr:hypothetical protein DIPPA_24392 [Diplonema papillatum]